MADVKVKVCGVTSPADARMVAEAGADWVGLNFHPASPRCITLERAAEIVAALPESVEPVGVFVDRTPDEIRDIAARVGLRTVQLHGAEPPEHVAALQPLRVVRAFRIADAAAIAAMADHLTRAEGCGRSPDAVLVDAYVPGVAGGTGHTIELEMLERLPALPRLILAGGLTPENVADRVRRIRPWMVDVAGGVEASPGRKDPARVAAFIRAARGPSDRFAPAPSGTEKDL